MYCGCCWLGAVKENTGREADEGEQCCFRCRPQVRPLFREERQTQCREEGKGTDSDFWRQRIPSRKRTVSAKALKLKGASEEQRGGPWGRSGRGEARNSSRPQRERALIPQPSGQRQGEAGLSLGKIWKTFVASEQRRITV